MKIEHKKNCIIIRDLFNQNSINAIKLEVEKLEASGGLNHENRANRYTRVNHKSFVKIHFGILDTIASIVGEPLKLSYSYYSRYVVGSELKKHTDRPICYYTLSYALDDQSDWPIFIENEKYILNSNEAILFKGRQLSHFREVATKAHTVILFHFVKPDYVGSLVPDETNEY